MADLSEFKAMERDGWGEPTTARGYATGFAMATVLVAERLADEVVADRGKNILDLCTGHGVVAVELIKRGAEVTGLDFSAAMIELAQEAAPLAKFVQGDALDMEFADAKFDAVTIGFGVPHFPDPARGLTEAARVLKPGGRIAFSIWRGKGSYGSFGWLFEAFAKFGDPAITPPDGPDAHMFTEPAIAQPTTKDAGFKDVQMSDIPSKLLISTPESLYDVFNDGAVRAASLLRKQSQSTSDAIRQYLADKVRAECQFLGDQYVVPAPSVVVSATRS